MNKIDLSGKRFGRLVVLCETDERRSKQIIWKCKCDCGKEVLVAGYCLRDGTTKSCGCYKRDKFTEMAKTYPRKRNSPTKERLYHIWLDMRRRTTNPKRGNYYRYGARGIRVCDKWYNSFDVFMEWALSHGYDNTLSIERIDIDGNYCPENCRWANKTEQARNKENTRYFEYGGKKKTVKEWSEITGIPYTTLLRRIDDGRTKDIFTAGRCMK